MNRRTFIKSTTGALVSTTVFASPLAMTKPKAKVLVLGGRDFFGPNIVELLLSRNYQVTLFNRGFTNADMFSHLPLIKGDREVKDGSGEQNLINHLKKTTYDLVIDTWQKAPKAVANMARILKSKVGHYHYVSSISVYKDKQHVGIDETYPLFDVSDVSVDTRRLGYAQRKTLAEMALFDELGDNVTTFRSHGMRSDRTPNRIYEPYWPVRFYRGGDILLPKQENHVMQVCDVSSMSDFMLTCFENGKHGAFNVAHPTTAFSAYLSELEKVTDKEHRKTWVPAAFLEKQGVLPYRDLPLWRPQLKGFYHIEITRALQAGLRNRPLTEVITDQLRGYLRRNPNDDFMFGAHGTISPNTELKVLLSWRKNRTNLYEGIRPDRLPHSGL